MAPDDVYRVTEAGRLALDADPVRLLRALAAELDVKAEAHRRAGRLCGHPGLCHHQAIADALDEIASAYRTRALQLINAQEEAR